MIVVGSDVPSVKTSLPESDVSHVSDAAAYDVTALSVVPISEGQPVVSDFACMLSEEVTASFSVVPPVVSAAFCPTGSGLFFSPQPKHEKIKIKTQISTKAFLFFISKPFSLIDNINNDNKKKRICQDFILKCLINIAFLKKIIYNAH